MRWVLGGVLGIVGLALIVMRWMQRVRHKATEQAQEEASLEKIRFLQRLDHELKNPLTAMQIALANLADVPDLETHHTIHATMRGQILRMSRLIGDLRKLATLEKGDMEYDTVNLSDLLAEVAQVFRENPDVMQRMFIADVVNDLPSVTADRDLLQLAIYNVLDNARKFTATDEHIRLTASTDGHWIAIQISDNGRGIPAEDLPHVWEDLYRSPDVQGVAGSGVGLAMVKGIIEQHDGSVEISSTYGDGTSVTLWLPLA